MEELQTLPLSGIPKINDKFIQQVKSGSRFHWKRTLCIVDDQDKKIVMISCNLFERIIWWSFPLIFFKYSKLKEIFANPEKITIMSPTSLTTFVHILNIKEKTNTSNKI